LLLVFYLGGGVLMAVGVVDEPAGQTGGETILSSIVWLVIVGIIGTVAHTYIVRREA
jgi:hypothetical protein